LVFASVKTKDWGISPLTLKKFLSFEAPDDTRGGIVATASVLRTGETLEVMGDLLVAADGSTSSIRRRFLPDFKLRFAA
jgi:flavin-dependent dehydrogenase